jgi:hypothetical protein
MGKPRRGDRRGKIPIVWRRRRSKVFGIGLHRTGTTSLNSSLQLLGLRSIHLPHDPKTQQEILGFLRDGGDRLRLSVLEHCDALTDNPVCATFEALDAAYPHSRFILTVRDKDTWLRSCETYWVRVVEPFLRSIPGNPFAVYVTTIGQALYGSAGFDLDRYSRAYDAYRERVDRHFRGREHDLLVLDLFSGQGWPELCAFLDRPALETPFPFENRTVSDSPASPQG